MTIQNFKNQMNKIGYQTYSYVSEKTFLLGLVKVKIKLVAQKNNKVLIKLIIFNLDLQVS